MVFIHFDKFIADRDILEAPGLGASKSLERPDHRLHAAVHGLRLGAPHLSSATLTSHSRGTLVAIALICAVPVLAMPASWIGIASAFAFALAFALIVLLRLAGLWELAMPRAPFAPPAAVPRDYLPAYTVLVPLYREAHCVPGLINALEKLDYPAGRLEILLITEADDAETLAAIAMANRPDNVRAVVVPDGLPRTKPRALNYALLEARGDFIAIFDAEDSPAPDQLLRAAAAFAAHDPSVACLQARLDIDGMKQSPPARQFTLEYAALFHGVLPALDRLGLPLPLGGTSNHFRRELLQRCGAWDPFNVTEDADLGIRFARLGYRVAMLDSATIEEPPVTWLAWFNQRTRWLKGWMQTYLVHMRAPLRLLRELGAWQFSGFQITLGGMILSALVHPWFFLLAVWNGLSSAPVLPDSGAMLWLCSFNLIAGYLAGAALAAVAAFRIGNMRLMRSAIWLPAYWLAISIAAYAALIDLARRPHYWHKTPHGARNGLASPSVL